jgi:hypothetical protein
MAIVKSPPFQMNTKVAPAPGGAQQSTARLAQ